MIDHKEAPILASPDLERGDRLPRINKALGQAASVPEVAVKHDGPTDESNVGSGGNEKRGEIERLSNYDVGRLYKHLVFDDEIPPREPEEGAKPIRIHIVNENTVSINDEEMSFEDGDLFVFNAFLLLGTEGSVRANDIRELGFREEPRELKKPKMTIDPLKVAIKSVTERLQDAEYPGFKQLIAENEGESGLAYSVGPVVLVTDIIREGHTVMVNYPDEEKEEEKIQVFQIPRRNNKVDTDPSITTLAPDLPLTSQLLGKSAGSAVEFTTNNGLKIKLEIVDFE